MRSVSLMHALQIENKRTASHCMHNVTVNFHQLNSNSRQVCDGNSSQYTILIGTSNLVSLCRHSQCTIQQCVSIVRLQVHHSVCLCSVCLWQTFVTSLASSRVQETHYSSVIMWQCWPMTHIGPWAAWWPCHCCREALARCGCRKRHTATGWASLSQMTCYRFSTSQMKQCDFALLRYVVYALIAVSDVCLRAGIRHLCNFTYFNRWVYAHIAVLIILQLVLQRIWRQMTRLQLRFDALRLQPANSCASFRELLLGKCLSVLCSL